MSSRALQLKDLAIENEQAETTSAAEGYEEVDLSVDALYANLPDILASNERSKLESTDDPVVAESSKTANMQLKELALEFKGKGHVSGHVFRQVMISDQGYIYEVHQPYPDLVSHYEVFQKRVDIRFNCISYPGQNAFGIWAWSCKTLDDALLRFEESVESKNIKR